MVINLLNNNKIFIEARTKQEFEAQMKGYYDKINDSTNSNGAIFMAILRGKVSEGLDFADMYGRGVIKLYKNMTSNKIDRRKKINVLFCTESSKSENQNFCGLLIQPLLNECLTCGIEKQPEFLTYT